MNLSGVSNPQTRFQLSAGLNVETLNAILVEPTIFEPRLKFKPRFKFLKFRWVHSLKYLRSITFG